MLPSTLFFIFFFFNDTATTEIYTLSLHDALPIFMPARAPASTDMLQTVMRPSIDSARIASPAYSIACPRSEEHTSELQSHLNLVCRLLLEKKNTSRYTVAARL